MSKKQLNATDLIIFGLKPGDFYIKNGDVVSVTGRYKNSIHFSNGDIIRIYRTSFGFFIIKSPNIDEILNSINSYINSTINDIY